MAKIHHSPRIHSGADNNTTGNLAGLIDHTLLRPDATKDQILRLCKEAKKYKFACVCVNPCYVPVCVKELKATQVKICTVIGFPLGASSTEAKIFEARQALRDGAREIDMVMNIGMLKSGNQRYLEKEISAISKISHKSGALVKVIVETALLTNDEKIKACLIAKRSGADFVKTSTGFSKGGATVRDVILLRKTVGSRMGVKASGGIRTRGDAVAMIAAGADRIGTSTGVKIAGMIIRKVTVKKSKK